MGDLAANDNRSAPYSSAARRISVVATNMASQLDYTPAGDPLTVPEHTADEAAWVAACEKVVTLLDGGASLAFNTQAFVEAGKAASIEEDAMMTMNGRQKQAYLAWKAGGVKLRDWNWDERKDVGNAKDWGAKITALKRMYGLNELSAEQTKAWVLANWDLHALWGAVIHVVRAERAACGGVEDRDPFKFVESVACRKFLRLLAMHTYKKEYTPGKPTDVFAKCKAGLEARLKTVTV